MLFDFFKRKGKKNTKENSTGSIEAAMSDGKKQDESANANHPASAGQKSNIQAEAAPDSGKLTEKQIGLTRTVIAHCAKLLGDAETGGREGFVLPGTENVGVLDLEGSRDPQEKWRVRISAVRRGTDWMVSNYLWSGSREEVVTQMLAEAGQAEILDAVLQLSQRVNQHWDD